MIDVCINNDKRRTIDCIDLKLSMGYKNKVLISEIKFRLKENSCHQLVCIIALVFPNNFAKPVLAQRLVYTASTDFLIHHLPD
jgi:hypothetical protein